MKTETYSDHQQAKYQKLASQAAAVEARTTDENITKQRLAKLYLDAGQLWAEAAALRRSGSYAETRFNFCRAALIRLSRHDLASQLDAL